MPRLTLTECKELWHCYIIERAEHDGSARFSDADVEGSREEMLAIAEAIEKRGNAHFRRCAVTAVHEPVRFWSPRNSTEDGIVSYAEADALAQEIRARLGAHS